jgi:tetratricopeptide (TPR) repeat protein
MILTPMGCRLGNFHLSTKKPEDAIEAFQRALATFPNDMNSLVGLKSAFEVLGKNKDAEVIEKRIADLKAE